MTTATAPLHRSKIDLPDEARTRLTELLAQQLADTSDLASQLKQAHWNVKGMHFQQVHELFDGVYAAVTPYVDMLAERITTLGGVARGTVRMAAEATRLPEYPLEAVGARQHLEAVRDRLAHYAGSTRRAIGSAEGLEDPTTADLFTEISRAVDLQLYFVESHLQGA